jgi:cobalt/nickel transport system permease protein
MHHAYIDKFAYQDSPIHRLDSRVKSLVTVVFTAFVLSAPKTSFSILVCYAAGPFAILVTGRIPLKFVFRHILVVSPFVLVLALTCPFYDRSTADVLFGPWSWQTTTGWLRCWTILGKFVVTMMALIALVSTTRFSELLNGLQKLGVPRILTVQLGFLYRYIFVLIDKAHHILQARDGRRMRSLGVKAEMKTAAAMLGSLFVRSIDSAERINTAMEARGFTGKWRTLESSHIARVDLVFAFASACFIICTYIFLTPA